MSAGRNASEGDGQPEKGGARWGRTTALVLSSIFGLFVLMIFVSSGMLAKILSYLWPTVYYTQVFADVTAEGQRYQLTSTAKCTLRAKARFWGLVGGPTPTVITGGLLVKRLPSGAGLIIIGPALCSEHDLYKIIHKEKFASPDDVRTVDLQKYLDFHSPAHRPKVLRLDDAAEPSQITAYWREYATSPDADIQVHSIRYKRLEDAPSSYPDAPEREVPWLKGRKAPTRVYCEPPATWVGFFSYVVGEEVWSNNDELREVGRLEEIEPIKWPKTVNIYEFPIQNIIINNQKNKLIIGTNYQDELGYFNFYKIDSLKSGSSYAYFTLVVGGKQIKPPNSSFLILILEQL